MDLLPRVTELVEWDMSALLAEANAVGATVFVLPSGISSRQALFQAMRTYIPMDPALVGTRSWDALADSLWGGLDSVASDHVVILWPDSHSIPVVERELALRILSDVAASLADQSATRGRPKQVRVYVG